MRRKKLLENTHEDSCNDSQRKEFNWHRFLCFPKSSPNDFTWKFREIRYAIGCVMKRHEYLIRSLCNLLSLSQSLTNRLRPCYWNLTEVCCSTNTSSSEQSSWREWRNIFTVWTKGEQVVDVWIKSSRSFKKPWSYWKVNLRWTFVLNLKGFFLDFFTFSTG